MSATDAGFLFLGYFICAGVFYYFGYGRGYGKGADYMLRKWAEYNRRRLRDGNRQ